MPQTATIKSLPAAFAMMKAMQAEDVEWGEDYRGAARDALAELLAGRMGQLIDEHLERMAELGEADRRNGCYPRWLLTELGMIELRVPRTRTFSALKVVRAYARRAQDVDRMILACFLLGLSTRKVAIALLPVLGRPVSPAQLEMLCVDGGAGLLAALPTAYPEVPVQRCWAHKIRNVLAKVRKPDQAAIKASLHRIMNATTLPRFADRWESIYPRAVACLRADLDDLLTCFRYPSLALRKAVRTTNAIERRFREVRRRTRPMGTFQDRTSMDRILFAVFMHENRNQGLATPFALTHNS
ncbi:MAG TPA: transposase [Geminicoccaceae bacterium]|jgi:transposase-like protein|nr:transposase [Geminicoccaceae bacterium]